MTRASYTICLFRMFSTSLVFVVATSLLSVNIGPLAQAITITMEYTDEGDPVPHDENPSWDPAGLILKQHFQAAKTIWETLLPGPGDYEFDFHWDDDISGLGLTTDLGALDVFIEINPTANWYIDPTPSDNNEFSFATAQTLYGGLTAQQQQTYFPGTAPPNSLEVGYWGTGVATFTNIAGQPAVNASTGLDLLSTIVHEMGHVLGVGADILGEPGDYNIMPQHVGGIEDVLVKEGDGGHLAGMGEVQFLMCEGCGFPGRRRIPTATDVLVIAEDQDITDVLLQRVGRISTGLWHEPNSWIGGDTPGFPQDVYVTQGGTVTLAANASAKDLSVAHGNTVAVGGNSLNLGGNLTFASGATISVGTGGTISAQNMIRGANDITTASGSLVLFNDYSGGGPTANFNGSIRIGNNGNTSPPTTFNPSTITTWTIAEEMAIDSGNGQINVVIDGTADFTSASGRVGPVTGVGAAPSVTVDGASASWDVNGPLAIPLGNVTVTNNGYLEANSSTVGSELGRSTLIVQNGNSRFRVINNLEVGPSTTVGDGQGTLNLRSNGRVIVDGNMNIHGTSTRTSEVSVQSEADLEVEGAINVGPYGLLTYRDSTFGYSGIVGSQTTNNLGGTNNGTGGITRFMNTSIANRNTAPATSQFTNHPGTTFFATGGSTEFRDSSSAGSAEFNNLPGGSVNLYSGTTRFFDNATAAEGQFFNHPGRWTVPPTVEFNGDSTGGNGTFVNLPDVLGVSLGGEFVFNDRAKAGTGTYTSQGEGGTVTFNDTSSADNGTFMTADTVGSGNSRISFHDDAKGGTATFSMGAGTILNFITRSSAEDATITLRQRSVASFGGEYNVPRLPTVTAGTADIFVEGSSVSGGYGGSLGFSTFSTAGNAIINTHGGTVAGAFGGTTRFDYEGRAGNATLITHGPSIAGAAGGRTEFARGANGDNAKAITHAGGLLTIASNRTYLVTTLGSIEGAGTYELSGAELQTGSLNTNTTVSGPIIDVPSTSLGGMLTKVGTGTLTLAGTNTYTGLTKIIGGALAVDGSIAGSAQVNGGGTLKGNGTIGGTVTVNAGGVFAPGTSAGTINVGGLMMTPSAKLAFEIGGTTPGSGYDQILSSGSFTFDGTLQVSLISGFTPTFGQSFNLIDWGSATGTFDAITLPSLGSGLSWNTSQLYASGTLSVGTQAPGDFDGDGDVDGRDFLAWQRNPALGNLADWQAEYNRGALVAGSTSVPEPQTWLLLLMSLAGLFKSRRCSNFHTFDRCWPLRNNTCPRISA